MFKEAHLATTDKEFNDQIWNKARNYVFHGRRYPEPKHLVELLGHSQKLHAAMDKSIDERLGLGNRLRPHRSYETWYRQFIFIEWETQSPPDLFANDCPTVHLAKMSEEEDVNGLAHQAAIADGIALLAYEESEKW